MYHAVVNLHSIARNAMANYGFIPDFSVKALKDIKAFSPRNFVKNTALRDLRDILWCSIDNLESQDLDQIEFCELSPNREIRVWVAIADVDEYVQKHSACDKHAHNNGTSVYTGVDVFPMLPRKLSHDLTSLMPGEDRFAVVIEYYVRKDGSVRYSGVFRAYVRNQAKLVYESAGDWLEKKGDIPQAVRTINGLEEQVRLQDEAAQRLHGFRMSSGALELETIEASPVLKDGNITGLTIKVKNRARYIIENFMIAANQTMMWFLEKNDSPFIQRILRPPERWPKIVRIAEDFGETLPETPDSHALSDFLIRRRAADPRRFSDLSLTVVKLLGFAEYTMTEPGKAAVGHFGLAVQDYIHSTAPNRRYVDVIIQRLIKAVLAKEPIPYTKRELFEIAEWCTERTNAARKVERFMRKAAAALLLYRRIGEVFEGIVTGASEKGTYVRLISPPAEGRVIRGEKGMDTGEKVLVRLINVEPEEAFIDFERADFSGYVHMSTKGRNHDSHVSHIRRRRRRAR